MVIVELGIVVLYKDEFRQVESVKENHALRHRKKVVAKPVGTVHETGIGQHWVKRVVVLEHEGGGEQSHKPEHDFQAKARDDVEVGVDLEKKLLDDTAFARDVERLSLTEFVSGINSGAVLETALSTFDEIIGTLDDWRVNWMEGIAEDVAGIGFTLVVVFDFLEIEPRDPSALETDVATS